MPTEHGSITTSMGPGGSNGIHVIPRWVHANATARTGQAGLTASDVGGVSHQTDQNTFWLLISYSPALWLPFAGTVVVSPVLIASDQNNYNPSDFSAAHVLRLSTDTTRAITGADASALIRRKTVINVGSHPVVLKHESSSSSAANRFVAPGSADLTILPDESVDIFYDSTSQRWRII